MPQEQNSQPPDGSKPPEASAAELGGQQVSGENRETLDARFEDLFRRYYQSVFAYFVRQPFCRDQAHDLAQVTFCRVYRSMRTFRGTGAWSFLQTTARRVALNELRSHQTDKRRGTRVPLDELPARASLSPEDVVVKEEAETGARRKLYSAIAELPEDLRVCVLLRLGGLDDRRIQEELHLSLDAVKSRLYKARRQLKMKVGEVPAEINEAPREEDRGRED